MQTATSQNQQSAMTEYVLHQRPEYLIYQIGNTTYKSYLNGQTFVLGSFGAWLPTSGCPVPEKLPLANFLAFLNRNAKWIPAMIMGCILVVVTHIALLVTDGAEFAAGWLQTFSAAMNTTLVVNQIPTTVKELPKTGLPLAAVAITSLFPVASRFRKMGKKGSASETANSIWMKKQLD